MWVKWVRWQLRDTHSSLHWSAIQYCTVNFSTRLFISNKRIHTIWKHFSECVHSKEQSLQSGLMGFVYKHRNDTNRMWSQHKNNTNSFCNDNLKRTITRLWRTLRHSEKTCYDKCMARLLNNSSLQTGTV